MENSELIQILSIIIGIISLIALIKFFEIASNVRKIKDQLFFSADDYISKAREELFVGNKEKTREYYLRARFSVAKSNWNQSRKKTYFDNIDKALNEL